MQVRLIGWSLQLYLVGIGNLAVLQPGDGLSLSDAERDDRAVCSQLQRPGKVSLLLHQLE